MNINSDDAKLVLLFPDLEGLGNGQVGAARTMICHSRTDDVIPFVEAEELVRNSGLTTKARIVVGSDHRLDEPYALAV